MEQDNKVLTIVIATFILVFVTNLPASIQEISDMLRQTQHRITMAEADINSGSLMSLAVKIKNKEDDIWGAIKGVKKNLGGDTYTDYLEADNEQNIEENTDEEIRQSCQEAEDVEKCVEQAKKALENQNDPNQTEEDNAGEKLETPLNFLLVGDSMMLVGFGPNLEAQLLNKSGVTAYREGQYSTGLNRVDYYDWYSKTDELINQYNPDVLIVMYGANDGQGILDENGVAYQLTDSGWDEVYRQRVYAYMNMFTSKVKKIYWVGHPITISEDFNPKFTRMNAIYKSESEKFENIEYIDMWQLMSVDGQYASAMPDKNGNVAILKQSDDVHVTEHGGIIMADIMIDLLSEDINW